MKVHEPDDRSTSDCVTFADRCAPVIRTKTRNEMKVAALVSGGKDSVFAMIECVRRGHDIVCLANLHPADQEVHEMDSYCFQTVGHNVVPALADCMDLPMYRRPILGSAVCQAMLYESQDDDEVEDLFLLLTEVLERHPDVDAVCTGAILSSYQKHRVEHVCRRLGLTSLAYLWERDQKQLYDEMINSGIVAVLIKTACQGLSPLEHIGRDLQSMRATLFDLADNSGCNPCGEGGEYESLVIDCPLFKRHIVLDECTIGGEDVENPVAPVGHLVVLSYHTEAKSADELEALRLFTLNTWKKSKAIPGEDAREQSCGASVGAESDREFEAPAVETELDN